MKILFTIKRLEAMAGGAEKVFTIVANGLCQRGHTVSVLSFDHHGAQSFYPLDPSITWLQHPIGDSARPATKGEFIRRISDTRCTIKSVQPDVIISFMHSAFIPTALAAIGTGVKVIGSEHIVAQHYQGRALDSLLYHLAIPFISKITVLSDKVRDEFPPSLRGKMVSITNPVIKPDNAAEIVPSSSQNILSIGRLDPQKDQETLIAAFARLAPEFPDWHLTIVGDGPLKADLEKQITVLSLKDRITLVPTTRSIASYYQTANIFAVPSLYESFGMATVEAMMFGLPCIGFQNCPGTNEIIRDNVTGLLVADTPDRVSAFADGLRQLMADEPKRQTLGATAEQHSKAYSVEPVLQKWTALLQA